MGGKFSILRKNHNVYRILIAKSQRKRPLGDSNYSTSNRVFILEKLCMNLWSRFN
jgi:hypothetical protein